MSKFSISSTFKLTRFSLKTGRKQIIGWSVVIFSIMFLYMILFPYVRDIAEAKLDAMPDEMLQFFGMSELSDMGNFIAYFGIIFNMLLIAISIFAASFGANLILKEEQTKTIEFLNSMEVGRSEIYISKLFTGFIAVLAVLCSAGIAAMICGPVNGGKTFVIEDLIKTVKISGMIPFIFLSVSLLFAGTSAKIGASMLSSISVLVCYILGFLSTILGDKGKWLSCLSPFEMFSPNKAIEFSANTAAAFAIYLAVSVCFVTVGGIVYKRRDLNI